MKKVTYCKSKCPILFFCINNPIYMDKALFKREDNL